MLSRVGRHCHLLDGTLTGIFMCVRTDEFSLLISIYEKTLVTAHVGIFQMTERLRRIDSSSLEGTSEKSGCDGCSRETRHNTETNLIVS